ncbi:MAG: Mth938-like domain-containing protein [Rubrivivax sp.]|nr:Mth938-like domain-containing protein [Rubrivivax sp.]
MKFQPDIPEGVNVITRHEPGRLWVGGTAFEHSLLLPWSGAVLPWPAASFDDLAAGHFERVLALAPEVVIFGSGLRLRFPPPAWLRGLFERRIGVETMDTAAACRTYNVLVGERRAVVAALVVESGPGPTAAAKTL